MNNPDHSTYHDFDDEDPEVRIVLDHISDFNCTALTSLSKEFFCILVNFAFCVEIAVYDNIIVLALLKVLKC